MPHITLFFLVLLLSGIGSEGDGKVGGSALPIFDISSIEIGDADSARREVCEYPSDLLSVSPTYGITLRSVDRDRFVIEYRTEDEALRLREYRRGEREHGKE